MTKTTIKTVLNNVIQLEPEYDSGPMMFTYTEEIISSKWAAELDSEPGSFVEVVQTHLSDDLNPGNGTSQHEIASDKPRDKKRIQ